jgi:uncharacterized protein (TIGR00369 family)
MTDTAIPHGFAPHYRKSPLTAPWEPIYSKVTETNVILGLRIAEAHTNSRGMAHGGLITALADNAMGLSCGHVLGGGTRLLTVNLSADFLGSAQIGQWLQIDTEVIKTGKRLCFAQALITADGEPCARANGTFSVAPPKT